MSEARPLLSPLRVETLKRLLALLILACAFLPLAHCSGRTTLATAASNPAASRPAGSNAAPQATPTASTPLPQANSSAAAPRNPDDDDFVPYRDATFSDGSGLVVMLPFVWPLALLAVRRGREASRRWQWSVNLVEILLAALSALYVCYIVDVWGMWRYGGILVIAAYAAHGLLASHILVGLVRQRPA